MNIVKLNNDSFVPNEELDYELYNSVFRGRYCYVVNKLISSPSSSIEVRLYPMKPLDDGTVYEKVQVGELYNYRKMKTAPVGVEISEVYVVKSNPTASDPQYVKLTVPGLTREQYINIVIGKKSVDDFPLAKSIKYSSVESKVETQKSELYSSTTYYEKKNHEINDLNKYNIDPSEIRIYRTNIAYIILKGLSQSEGKVLSLCPQEISMLNYYRDDMNDTTIESIKLLKKDGDLKSKSATVSSCGCNISINGLSSLNIASANCDIEREYRYMMKQLMIKIFTNISFWNKISLQYKKGLDDIIDLTHALIESGLSPFGRGQKMDLNYCCSTLSGEYETLYLEYKKDLENIAEAFDLILKEDTSRPSFVNAQLAKFATMYEYLQWDGEMVIEFSENWE